MFFELNNELKTSVPATLAENPIFELHPLQLSAYLEAVWEVWRKLGEGSLGPPSPGAASATAARAVVPALGVVGWDRPGDDVPPPETVIRAALAGALQARDPDIGPPALRRQLDALAATRQVINGFLAAPARGRSIAVPWYHLIYAYLIENTRIFEIFQRVLHEAVHDENLGALSEVTFRWVRTTEDLFFRDGNSSLIASITSAIRPDARATRRNAYHRMFGIDLNHGASDGGAYPYPKAAAANSDFVSVLQELLRELWRGYINSRNTSGQNTTDDSAIIELVQRLRIMMGARRLSADGGRANLAREEFVAVSLMSWFHLTVATNTKIIDDLKADGDQPEDRLRKIGERVKLPAHGKSRSFFILAGTLPALLREIEDSIWDSAPSLLYDVTLVNNVTSRTVQIINHWSIATGVDLKATPVASGPR